MIITIREVSDEKHYLRFRLHSTDLRVGDYGAYTDDLFETMLLINSIVNKLGEECIFKIVH